MKRLASPDSILNQTNPELLPEDILFLLFIWTFPRHETHRSDYQSLLILRLLNKFFNAKLIILLKTIKRLPMKIPRDKLKMIELYHPNITELNTDYFRLYQLSDRYIGESLPIAYLLENFTNLTSLTVKYISSIESPFILSTKITTLKLDGNTFLSPHSSSMRINSITSLTLSCDTFISSTTIQSMTNLTYLVTNKILRDSDLLPLVNLYQLIIDIGNYEIKGESFQYLTKLSILHINNWCMDYSEHLTNLKLIEFTGNLSDNTLCQMTNLRILHLSERSKAESKSIGLLTNLTSLSVDSICLMDSDISQLTNLVYLHLPPGGTVTDIVLDKLPKLKSLKLPFNRIYENFVSLRTLSNLTSLDIYQGIYVYKCSCYFLEDDLVYLTNLTSLSIAYCKIENGEIFRNLTNLQKLDLRGNRWIRAEHLTHLKKLTDLVIDSCTLLNIKDLPPTVYIDQLES